MSWINSILVVVLGVSVLIFGCFILFKSELFIENFLKLIKKIRITNIDYQEMTQRKWYKFNLIFCGILMVFMGLIILFGGVNSILYLLK